MISLLKDYKKISNKYNSNSNIISSSENDLIPKNKAKILFFSSRKTKYQRNKEEKLDYFKQGDINDYESIKQKQYFTSFNKKNIDTKYASLFSSEENKTNNLNIKHIKKTFYPKRYNNYYISSNLLKYKYISDITSAQKDVLPMKETDEKIDDLIKYLNLSQKTIKTDKFNKLSKSFTQRFILEENKNKSKTIINNLQRDKNIGTGKLFYKAKKLSKDMYLYKKIFYYSDKKKTFKHDIGLDNKLNIIYSENEKQYRQNLNKLNEIYKHLGKKKIYTLEPSQSENKVKNLQKRVEFMKRIVDYTYPDMVLTKIKEHDKTLFEKSVVPVNIITSKIKRKNYNKNIKKISQGLIKSLHIKKFIVKSCDNIDKMKGYDNKE